MNLRVPNPTEFEEKALLVRNLNFGTAQQWSDDQLRDKLTIHFQNRKSSCGGDVMRVIYPLNSRKDDAIVLFEDAKGK